MPASGTSPLTTLLARRLSNQYIHETTASLAIVGFRLNTEPLGKACQQLSKVPRDRHSQNQRCLALIDTCLVKLSKKIPSPHP